MARAVQSLFLGPLLYFDHHAFERGFYLYFHFILFMLSFVAYEEGTFSPANAYMETRLLFSEALKAGGRGCSSNESSINSSGSGFLAGHSFPVTTRG